MAEEAGAKGRINDPQAIDPGEMGSMSSQTREVRGRLRPAAIKDALPLSLS
jgi:hypothetical protein